MSTVFQIYQYIKNSLETIYDTREAENITTILLCYVFHFSERIELHENRVLPIDIHTEKLILHKLKRLMRYEPVQYVIHTAWFYSLDLYVNRHTLIPRPETEEMVHTLLMEHSSTSLKVLDIATGSGCIALALKKNRPGWEITATDISNDALQMASCNAKKHFLEISFLNDDIFNSVLYKQSFDIIICNPPYIPVNEKEHINKNVILYEPSLALFVPSENPLVYYEELIKIASACLKKSGQLYVEVHEQFAHEVEQLFAKSGFTTELFFDFNHKPRYIKSTLYGQK